MGGWSEWHNGSSISLSLSFLALLLNRPILLPATPSPKEPQLIRTSDLAAARCSIDDHYSLLSRSLAVRRDGLPRRPRSVCNCLVHRMRERRQWTRELMQFRARFTSYAGRIFQLRCCKTGSSIFNCWAMRPYSVALSTPDRRYVFPASLFLSPNPPFACLSVPGSA